MKPLFYFFLFFFTFNTLQAQNLLDNPSTNIKTVLQIMGNPLWELREICLNDTCKQSQGPWGIGTSGFKGDTSKKYFGVWMKYMYAINSINYQEEEEKIRYPSRFNIQILEDSITQKSIYQLNINRGGCSNSGEIVATMNLILLHEKVLVFEGISKTYDIDGKEKKLRETYFLRKENE